MSCCHHHVANAKRIDPTHTLAIRKEYDAQIRRRFRKLRTEIRKALIDGNALRLTPGPRTNDASPGAVQSFMRWLKRAQDRDILDVSRGTPAEFANRNWQNLYLRAAYQRGVTHAAGRMRGQGARVETTWIEAAFNRPIHADRAGLIYTSSWDYLQAANTNVASRVSGILAQGVVEGVGVREIAKRIDEAVAIGMRRAQAIARTETIRAHAEATLNAYEEADAEGVLIEAEYTTAGDGSVCEKCSELEGTVITIEEARSPRYRIPLHPNCRCAWNPVVRNPQGIILR